MVKLKESTNITPLCPHCEAPQKTINYQPIPAFLGRRYVYFCDSCRKVLSISHRKGFWMG